MAFVAGAAARGAGSRAAAGAAGKSAASTAGKGAAGSAGKSVADRELAKELADFNAVDATGKGGAGAPAPAPAGPSGGSSKPKPGGTPVGPLRAAAGDQRGTPGWFRDATKVSSPTYIANAGGGALLGALVWVVGLTYLRDGKPGVARWVRAKFFNEVDGS